MKFRQGNVGDLLRILLWYPYRWGVSFLPPARELSLSRHLGRLMAWTDPGEVDRVVHNLARAFPGRPGLRSIAVRTLESRIEDEFLSLSFEKLDRTTLASYLEFEGLERLEQALAKGRGCILAYPHFGPIMLPLFGLGLLGFRLAQISSQEEPDSSSAPALAAFHIRRHLETLVPATIVNARSYLRPTLRRLKEGETVMIAYDGTGGGQEVGRRVSVRLLGQQVLFPVGALYMALRSGAPLLTLSIAPGTGTAAYKVTVSPELVLEHPGDLRETLRHNAQRLALMLEAEIRQHPECWHLWPEFEPDRLIDRGDSSKQREFPAGFQEVE